MIPINTFNWKAAAAGAVYATTWILLKPLNVWPPALFTAWIVTGTALTYVLLQQAYGDQWPERFLDEAPIEAIAVLFPIYLTACIHNWWAGGSDA